MSSQLNVTIVGKQDISSVIVIYYLVKTGSLDITMENKANKFTISECSSDSENDDLIVNKKIRSVSATRK